MSELANLALLRKRYLELAKLFFLEIQKGKSLDEISDLKNQIDGISVEIKRLEKELNLNHSATPDLLADETDMKE